MLGRVDGGGYARGMCKSLRCTFHSTSRFHSAALMRSPHTKPVVYSLRRQPPNTKDLTSKSPAYDTLRSLWLHDYDCSKSWSQLSAHTPKFCTGKNTEDTEPDELLCLTTNRVGPIVWRRNMRVARIASTCKMSSVIKGVGQACLLLTLYVLAGARCMFAHFRVTRGSYYASRFDVDGAILVYLVSIFTYRP